MKRLHWVQLLSYLVILNTLPCRAVLAQETSQDTSFAHRLMELRERINKYEAALPLEHRIGPGLLAQAKLAIRKTEEVQAASASLFDTTTSAKKRLDAAEKVVTLLETEKTEPMVSTGFQERAYISTIDGPAEPYVIYVPTTYDPMRKYPLLVFLHGYVPDLNTENWIRYSYSLKLQSICEEEGAILLLPYGRSNTEFMGIGESDVLRVIEYVRREYNVDPTRIVLLGVSMGGSGTYSIACHYPDMFAGVIVLTGRVDFFLWTGAKRENTPLFKQIQVDTDYALNLLPNLSSTPVLIFHGDHDYAVQVEQSRLAAKLLNEYGQPVTYVEFQNSSHPDIWLKGFVAPEFREMIRSARLSTSLRKVIFRTYTTKYSSAYWVHIDAIETWGKIAEVTAEAIGTDIIRLSAQNVASLTLGPNIPGSTHPAAARVIMGDKTVAAECTPAGELKVQLSPFPTAGVENRKTKNLSGPIREAYDGPFVIVFPSKEDAMCIADRQNALRLAQEWFGFARGQALLRSDRDITEAEIQNRNLILCGSPATNSVLARMADRLPIIFSKTGYIVDKHVFAYPGNGIQFIYPSPLSPHHYVLVIHGIPWGAGLQKNHKLDFLPDFIIYTGDMDTDNKMFPTNHFLCAGYFDNLWRFSEKSLWLAQTEKPGKSQSFLWTTANPNLY